jgi:hypothetical protein
VIVIQPVARSEERPAKGRANCERQRADRGALPEGRIVAMLPPTLGPVLDLPLDVVEGSVGRRVGVLAKVVVARGMSDDHLVPGEADVDRDPARTATPWSDLRM